MTDHNDESQDGQEVPDPAEREEADADPGLVVSLEPEPTEPADPEAPAGPEAPAEPTEPAEPAKPSEPEEPTEPTAAKPDVRTYLW